ncbi:MAG: hypothetical protein KTR16_09710 [Acidiferrobacterales bacterium]|nr:hypothetical protein [Acidiferrobacterales bacterium]
MKTFQSISITLILLTTIIGCSSVKTTDLIKSNSGATSKSKEAILNHYADIALATYSDSLTSAQALHQQLQTLIDEPTEENLNLAQIAWKDARIPYMQSEAYRFGNAIVDDWEVRVNAWPLDEGLIDYVASSYGAESEDNPLYTANVIANTSFKLSGNTIDASQITKELLTDTLHEIDGVEANVAIGYHAIEFLLWGQDLNGTNAGAGNRPAADFDQNNCASNNCDRRGQYLLTASALLLDELEWIITQWQNDGAARQSLLEDEDAGITAILTGLGSLSYGEMAGERMKLGVLLHDPEEEHDCFSDNTHNSHFLNIKGMQNVYTGNYTRQNGETLSGPSVSDLVARTDNTANAELLSQLENSLAKAQILVDSAEQEGVAYDQLLAEDNSAGNAKILAVVTALLEQTKGIEKAVGVLGIQRLQIEGSDSLDSPSAVFQ